MFIDGYKSYMLHSDSPMVVSDSQCNNIKHPFDTLLTVYSGSDIVIHSGRAL